MDHRAQLLQEAQLKKLTFCVAESCTGGHLSACLTEPPGASIVFLGGVVAYSVSLKKTLLHVPQKLIDGFGVVSPEIAKSMAMGAQKLIGANIALGITGYAGPTADVGKEVGTVCSAIVGPHKSYISFQDHLQGERLEVISQAVELSVGRLLEFVTHL